MTGGDGHAAIERALGAAGIEGRIVRTASLGGGCIHRVLAVDLDTGRRVVAKTNGERFRPVFEEEIAGLRALAATETVLVPRPIAVTGGGGAAMLLMDFLPAGPPAATTWPAFGRELARLHRAPGAGRYGFDLDNHLGATPQDNGWEDDWVEFNQRRRFGPQLRRASDAGLLAGAERARIATLVDGLDRHLPRRPHASLLHGDLWSGNALVTTWRDAPRVAVIDPAPSFGDGWADIAMMRLFGGFPEACFAAYAEAVGEPEHPPRIAVYQVYHLLNHVSLFGRGYVEQVMALVDRL
jgi:fructosamine-3-kinase